MVPCWAYAQSVYDLAHSEDFCDRVVPMSRSVGPAIIWAKVSLSLLWLGCCGYAYLSYILATCDGHGQSLYPWWLWISFTPTLIMFGWLELVCLKYTTIPYIQVTGEYRFLGCATNFHCWFAIGMLQSAIQRADMLSDGIFIAMAVHDNEVCQNMNNIYSRTIEQVWVFSASSSFVVPVSVSYFQMVLISCLLVSVQLIYSLLVTTARCGDSVDYVVGLAKADGTKAMHRYKNVFCEDMNLGDTLFLLGEAAGMNLLQKQSISYPRAKQEQCSDPKLSLVYVRNAIARGVLRLGVVGILENCAQLYLQICVFALKRMVDSSRPNYQGLASIVLSLVMNAIKLGDAFELLKFWSEVQAKVKPDTEWAPGMDAAEDQLHKEYNSVVKYSVALKLASFIIVIFTFYMVAKLSAAYMCKDAVWHLSSGCIDLGHLNSTSTKH